MSLWRPVDRQKKPASRPGWERGATRLHTIHTQSQVAEALRAETPLLVQLRKKVAGSFFTHRTHRGCPPKLCQCSVLRPQPVPESTVRGVSGLFYTQYTQSAAHRNHRVVLLALVSHQWPRRAATWMTHERHTPRLPKRVAGSFFTQNTQRLPAGVVSVFCPGEFISG